MAKMITTLCFVGANLSSLHSFKKGHDLFHNAFILGIRHFDTVPLYGQEYSELVVVKGSEISITTKFGLGDTKSIYIPVHLLCL
jgi:aryl-alcohol dehydrogenase-like predicted oxidoreductase